MKEFLKKNRTWVIKLAAVFFVKYNYELFASAGGNTDDPVRYDYK